MSAAGSVRVDLLYCGHTAAASSLASAVAGWDGAGSADGERVRLAEGPLWDASTGTLYFIDILGRKLHALHNTAAPAPTDGQQAPRTVHKEWSLPALPGTVCLTEQSGVLLLALQDGLYLFDTASGACVHSGASVEPGVADNRCNDGKVDPSGRLVVGTMCLDEGDRGKGRGGLYSVDGATSSGSGAGQWQCRRLLSGLSIPNGLAWSKDGRRFFHTDTPTRQIREYQYDVHSGDIAGEGRVAITLPDDFGMPDGLAIDEDDMLWIASWGGGRVCRVSPVDGRVLLTVPVGAGHVSRISSCAFGGPSLTDLYITTAAPDEPFDYSAEGLAGSVFVARNVGAKGTLATPFKGALRTSQP